MTRRTAFRDPAVRPPSAWMSVNRGCFSAFQKWLRDSGYGSSALTLYSVAARLAFGLLDKPYWTIDVQDDLEWVRDYIREHYLSAGTQATYLKGIARLEAYLRLRCRRPKTPPTIYWETYVGRLPAAIAAHVRSYVAHRQRQWPAERQAEAGRGLVSRLTRSLRWLADNGWLKSVPDLTPKAWYAYVDARLAEGLKPVSLNFELCDVLGWLRWLEEQDEPVCTRLFRLKPAQPGPRIPKDVPPEQLRKLLDAVQAAAASPKASLRRYGRLDHAWMLLMLHSGLRTMEVRRLRPDDIDWERKRVRIEQSKGLKDRLVPLSEPTIAALKAYLEVRGPAEALPAALFIYRHAPLSRSYCGKRLAQYYAHKTGVMITPHQLRHSCATMLLNAGVPILTVRAILGHFHIDTTLAYARLYDGTVAADYYRAMVEVERTLVLPGNPTAAGMSDGELVALVDSLRSGTLNDYQAETVRVLRSELVSRARRDAGAPAEG